jgi:hypothetical protein
MVEKHAGAENSSVVYAGAETAWKGFIWNCISREEEIRFSGRMYKRLPVFSGLE